MASSWSSPTLTLNMRKIEAQNMKMKANICRKEVDTLRHWQTRTGSRHEPAGQCDVEAFFLPLRSGCICAVGRARSTSSWTAAENPRSAYAERKLWHSRTVHIGCCPAASHPATAVPRRLWSGGWSPWGPPEQRTRRRTWRPAWWTEPLKGRHGQSHGIKMSKASPRKAENRKRSYLRRSRWTPTDCTAACWERRFRGRGQSAPPVFLRASSRPSAGVEIRRSTGSKLSFLHFIPATAVTFDLFGFLNVFFFFFNRGKCHIFNLT